MISVFKIPVIPRTSDYIVWRLSSIPLELIGSPAVEVIQVRLPSEVMIIDNSNRRINLISLSEYNMCHESQGRVCHHSLPWNLIGSANSCLESLASPILNSSNILEFCEVKSLRYPAEPRVYATSITTNQWLISTIRGPLTVSYKCG